LDWLPLDTVRVLPLTLKMLAVGAVFSQAPSLWPLLALLDGLMMKPPVEVKIIVATSKPPPKLKPHGPPPGQVVRVKPNGFEEALEFTS